VRFVFWTLILFGSWAGIPAGAPVPAWMPALSRVATVLLAVPLLMVAVIAGRSLLPRKRFRRAEDGAPHRQQETADAAGAGIGVVSMAFIRFGLAAWLVAGALSIAGALPALTPFLRFTWFGAGVSRLNVSGFFAMTLFGAIYHIVPRVAGRPWPWARAVRAHFWLGAVGVMVAALPLAAGGVVQGLKLHEAQSAFLDSAGATLPFLRASTTGDLLWLLGNLLLFLNLAVMLACDGRDRLVPFYRSVTAELDPAEVRP
jgi:cytochrome c oxidase cbb3-type subunit 1